MTFGEAAIAIYKYHSAILFAISIEKEGEHDRHARIVFNPYDTVLRGGERAYLITDQSRTAHKVGKHNFPSFHSTDYSDDSPFWNERKMSDYLNEIRRSSTPSASPGPSRKKSVALSQGRLLGSLEIVPSVINAPDSFAFQNQGASSAFNVLNPNKTTKNVEEDAPTITENLPKRASNSLHNVVVSQNIPKVKDKSVHESPVEDFVKGASVPETVRDHVLFCSLADEFPKNLPYFIAPYRHKDSQTPIVILCSSEPSEEYYDEMKEYGHVFYIVGTPLLRKDLRKALVHRARRTICLAKNSSFQRERSADANVLLALLNIQALCVDTQNFVTVEFIHNKNMKLIGHTANLPSYAAASDVIDVQIENITPAFVGGHVFSQTMFHSILCQAFYEKNVLTVLKVLVCFNTDVFVQWDSAYRR